MRKLCVKSLCGIGLAFGVLSFACAAGAYAQQKPIKSETAAETAKPSITADQIFEKSIEAAGGREAAKKLTSLVMTGTMEIVSMGGTATTEVYAKAPDKRVIITNVDGYGEIASGYDGEVGWDVDPQGGLTELSGIKLADRKLQSEFDGDLKVKDLYPKTEVTGKEKVEGRDCWVVKMTPPEGNTITRYYDAETFLLAKAVFPADTPQGPGNIEMEFSDYRDIGNGLKMAYKDKLTIPGIGDLNVTYKEIKYNVPIDDSKFAKPKSQ